MRRRRWLANTAIAVAVATASASGIALAQGGGSKPTSPARPNPAADLGAGKAFRQASFTVPDSIAVAARTALQTLVSQQAISQSQADAVQAQVEAGWVD